MNLIPALKLNSTAKSIPKQKLLPSKQCVYSFHQANTPLGTSAVINLNISFFFYPQSQHGRIKGSVRGRNGVWPAITYALVIWLYWLWAACCAMLLGLGNIKLIIAIDRQSICQCVELGGWADGVLASLLFPLYSDICAANNQQAWHKETAGECVSFSNYIYIYIHMSNTHWTFLTLFPLERKLAST